MNASPLPRSAEHSAVASIATMVARYRSHSFTILGPPPSLSEGTDLLDDLNAIWAEEEWSQERLRQAEEAEARKDGYVSQFKRKQLESRAELYWNHVYKRNGDRMYKDRHYLSNAFPELMETAEDRAVAARITVPGKRAPNQRALLELGCGVGNCVFPLLNSNAGLFIVAVDMSRTAITILKENPLFNSLGRCVAKVCNTTRDALPPEASEMDFVLLLFCLSAVSPELQPEIIHRAVNSLKINGQLLLRDYGRYDEAQIRFMHGRESRIANNFYVRQDGTLAYYFTIEDIRRLCLNHGLEEIECQYLRRQYVNRHQKSRRSRVWVQAKFRKT
eukprot:425438_1